jgi:signal peptidase II
MKLNAPGSIKVIFIVVVVMLNIGCDQISKDMVRERIGYDQNIHFLANHFTLTKVENAGAFLSLGDHIPATIKFIVLTLIPILILAAGLIYLMTKQGIAKVPLIAACFIIGGGIGNVYDRWVYGSVTDFMHIGFGFLQTGIFNMADVSVTVGVGMIFVYYLVQGKRHPETKITTQ